VHISLEVKQYLVNANFFGIAGGHILGSAIFRDIRSKTISFKHELLWNLRWTHSGFCNLQRYPVRRCIPPEEIANLTAPVRIYMTHMYMYLYMYIWIWIYIYTYIYSYTYIDR